MIYISFRYILPVISILLCLFIRTDSLSPDSLATSLCARLLASAYFCVTYWKTPNLFQDTDIEKLKSIRWIFDNTQSTSTSFGFIALIATLIFFIGSFIAFAAIKGKVNSFVLIAASINAIFRLLGYLWRYPVFKTLIESGKSE